MKKYLVSTLCSLITTAAIADEPYDERFSGTFNECYQQALDTASRLACYEEEYATQDKRLNVAYKKLIQGIPKADQALLKNAQRQWIKYRDADFKLYSEYSSGTGMGVFAVARKTAQVAQRAKELEILLDRSGIYECIYETK